MVSLTTSAQATRTRRSLDRGGCHNLAAGCRATGTSPRAVRERPPRKNRQGMGHEARRRPGTRGRAVARPGGGVAHAAARPPRTHSPALAAGMRMNLAEKADRSQVAAVLLWACCMAAAAAASVPAGRAKDSHNARSRFWGTGHSGWRSSSNRTLTRFDTPPPAWSRRTSRRRWSSSAWRA